MAAGNPALRDIAAGDILVISNQPRDTVPQAAESQASLSMASEAWTVQYRHRTHRLRHQQSNFPSWGTLCFDLTERVAQTRTSTVVSRFGVRWQSPRQRLTEQKGAKYLVRTEHVQCNARVSPPSGWRRKHATSYRFSSPSLTPRPRASDAAL